MSEMTLSNAYTNKAQLRALLQFKGQLSKVYMC
jgi:hypothetical protein